MSNNIHVCLPDRMREQVNKLAAQLNTSRNQIIVRLLQERLEQADLWPPPHDDSHVYRPRRVLAPNPKSAFTREQLGFDPVITDPEQLKFEEDAKALVRSFKPDIPVPNITDGSAVAHATNQAALISQILQAGPDMPSTPLDSTMYYKRGHGHDENPR